MGMLRYSEVKGLPVISSSDGKKIGIIEDMIFCPSRKEAKAFLLGRQGYGFQKRVVMLSEVESIGRDAVMVNTRSSGILFKKAVEDGELQDEGDIAGLRIYSRSGEDLGEVKDILFDYKTGMVEGVEVSDGLFQDIIQGRKILPLFGKVEFGEESLIVDREAVDEMLNTGGGIIKKLLEQRKE